LRCLLDCELKGSKPNTRSTVVTEEQFHRVLTGVGEKLKPILLIAYDHGMRKREVLDLRWDQVDLQAGKVDDKV
jgi:integrase